MAEMEKALAYQRDVQLRRATREDATDASIQYSG
jgi:hypothetical protein